MPLKPEAIQIAVTGEADKEQELRDVLQSVLNNLDGQTNWLNTEQRVGKLVEGITRLTVTACVVVVIAVVVWRAARNKGKGGGRTKPRTTPDDRE